METRILTQIEFYKKIIFEIYKIDLKIENVKFDIKGTCAGKAIVSYGKYYLRFNPSIYNNSQNSEVFLTTTIPHELSHLVVFELERLGFYKNPKSHGVEWKEIMKKLGVSPTRVHNFDLSTTFIEKIVYKCECQTHYLSKREHNNILNGSHYLCKKCKNRLIHQE